MRHPLMGDAPALGWHASVATASLLVNDNDLAVLRDTAPIGMWSLVLVLAVLARRWSVRPGDEIGRAEAIALGG